MPAHKVAALYKAAEDYQAILLHSASNEQPIGEEKQG